jgi:hypothetical protein
MLVVDNFFFSSFQMLLLCTCTIDSISCDVPAEDS